MITLSKAFKIISPVIITHKVSSRDYQAFKDLADLVVFEAKSSPYLDTRYANDLHTAIVNGLDNGRIVLNIREWAVLVSVNEFGDTNFPYKVLSAVKSYY